MRNALPLPPYASANRRPNHRPLPADALSQNGTELLTVGRSLFAGPLDTQSFDTNSLKENRFTLRSGHDFEDVRSSRRPLAYTLRDRPPRIGVLAMIESQKNSWLRTALLIGALAAGGLMTQLVPTYQEMASTANQPSKPTSASESNSNPSRGVSEFDVDLRRLALVRGIA
jgi:hypothetical protein